MDTFINALPLREAIIVLGKIQGVPESEYPSLVLNILEYKKGDELGEESPSFLELDLIQFSHKDDLDGVYFPHNSLNPDKNITNYTLIEERGQKELDLESLTFKQVKEAYLDYYYGNNPPDNQYIVFTVTLTRQRYIYSKEF